MNFFRTDSLETDGIQEDTKEDIKYIKIESTISYTSTV